MANVYWEKRDLARAQNLMGQAIDLRRQVGDLQGIAYDTVKHGQLSQARGDTNSAIVRYREGLEIFEKLGAQREISQVRQMIAQLEGGAAPANDPLAQAIGRARQAAQQGKVAEAIAAQEEAVALARQTGDSREALVNLSVLLYNLGGYYLNADRPEEAVHALEEVVALDERTGHPDLESDRRMLEQARHMGALSPEERARLQSTAADDEDQAEPGEDGELDLNALPPEVVAQLQGLSPAERAQIEAQLRQAIKQLQAMSPEERAQLAAAQQAGAQRQQIEMLAQQARDGALAALRGQTDRAALAGRIQQVIDQISAREAVTSPWGELVAYLQAVVALLNHEAVPPVPAAYAAHFAAIQSG